MNWNLRELLTYGSAAAAALVVDVALLHFLVSVAGLHYLVAATLSFTTAAAMLYFVCVGFIFQHRRLANRSAEFVSFAGIGAIGLLLNAAVIALAVQWLQYHYVIGKLAAAGFTFTTNYAARRIFLFTPFQRLAATDGAR